MLASYVYLLLSLAPWPYSYSIYWPIDSLSFESYTNNSSLYRSVPLFGRMSLTVYALDAVVTRRVYNSRFNRRVMAGGLWTMMGENKPLDFHINQHFSPRLNYRITM